MPSSSSEAVPQQNRLAPMIDEFEDRSYFFSKRPDKTYVSRTFRSQFGTKLRIVSKVVDGDEGLRFGKAGDEVVLRTTPAGRYEIKATVLEDNRAIKTLLIQKYSSASGPLDRQGFAFVGEEIDVLLNFGRWPLGTAPRCT